VIDLARFRNTPLVRQPFEHLVVPGFIDPGALPSLMEDFPEVPQAGSFPNSELRPGRTFEQLLEELRGPTLRKAVEAKFSLDLSGRPTMVTVRGHSRAKDGRIHADSRTKILTVLIYMNSRWADPGGRLRLLRSPGDLEDYFTEVVPENATAVFFRCVPNAWHGHTPFAGERRAIQLNWVADEGVLRREQGRHRLSARLKRFLPI
jgi:SM-20-related protein